MGKLFIIILVLLTCLNVNGQNFNKEIKFTTINSSEINFFKIDSVLVFAPNLFIGIENKNIKLSINNIDFGNTPSVKVRLPKVILLTQYPISQNIGIRNPDWDFNNIDAFGFKLFYKIKYKIT